MTKQVYSLIGLPININDLWITRPRECDCDVDYDQENPPNFCSKCGRRFISQYSQEIEDYDFKMETLHGYRLLFESTRTDPTQCECRVFVCASWVSFNGCPRIPFSPLPTDHLEKLRIEMSEKLGPRLWDDKKFGLYIVPRISPQDEKNKMSEKHKCIGKSKQIDKEPKR